ncbi:hypothetical protein F5Y00DRAFT_151611 [Daldinia vernicosa]|uniref:uncharacterized protein n=1 Tax=Daldinia vernicosa TaxID=114800 RepID=UPI002008261D|nr:uncharacterized protein F5Y00DRAFT_151611 [Daldinia vernicosa]KAI0846093.1 hypothetical protein F5Y00DRAFT_151611 [Daldinia vernicosa]
MPPPLAVRCTHGSSPSAARLFVRLLCASSSPIGSSGNSSSSSTSILDVLLPPRTRAFHLARDIRGRARNPRVRNDGTGGISHVPYGTARRHFSATAPWRKTQVVYNPQKDEDGNDMILEITPRAANKLSQIMVKDKNPNLALRISVESGGCHGFQYLMSLTTLPPSLPCTPDSTASAHPPPETSSTPPAPANQEDGQKITAEVAPSTTTSAAPSAPSISEDDTVFAFVKDDLPPSSSDPHSAPPSSSSPSSSSGPSLDLTGVATPKIILDSPSLELLKGSKVDYTMELIGSQFKIVDNPLATSSCGCGTSFDIKI